MRETVRLARIARTISGVGFPPADQGHESGDLPFLKVSDLAHRGNVDGIKTSSNWVSSETAVRLGVRTIPHGSVVFPKVGAALLGNARGLTLIDCAIDNNMMAVVPSTGDSRYWYYLLKSIDMGPLFAGGTLPFVSDTSVRDLPVPNLGVEEQRRIANFLDDQVTRIDNIIAARRQQLADIDREYSAGATELVESAMRAHGRMAARRTIFRIEQGWSPQCSTERAAAGEAAVMKLGAVRRGVFRSSENKAMLPETTPDHRYLLRVDDLLVTRANTPDLVGDSAVVRTLGDLDLYLSDLVYRIGTHADPEFLGVALRSQRNRQLIRTLARGTSQSMAKIRGEDIANLVIPAAPAHVQRVMGEQDVFERQQLARRTNGFVRSIDLLTEYKQSLITAAVTGELDVTTASKRVSG